MTEPDMWIMVQAVQLNMTAALGAIKVMYRVCLYKTEVMIGFCDNHELVQ